MTDRKMSVRFNGQESSLISLIGGFPQGSLIGQDAYIVSSDDCADMVNEDDRFRYIDDLEILELISLTGILQDYDIWSHVPSDISVDQQFLSATHLNTQTNLNKIAHWTDQNIMQINSKKSNFMLFSRSKENFTTRLTINSDPIVRQSVTRILGVWISEDAGCWEKNTSEICKKSFSRILMLTKLRYVGVSIEDLLDIYRLFIRSCAEYTSVAFHSSLTSRQFQKLENHSTRHVY